MESSGRRRNQQRMDPLEWQRLADLTARRLEDEIDRLEGEFWPLAENASLRTFWPQVQDLHERVRTAPAIKLDDKLSLQRHLNELCQRARQHRTSMQQRARDEKRELLCRVELVRSSIDEQETSVDLQQTRADLSSLRERIKAAEVLLRLRDRQEVWHAWHEANRDAWQKLNEIWKNNERTLVALLERAREQLTAGEARAAKDQIKAFHAAVPEHECSHRALKTLRAEASALWREADECAKQKHDAYLAHVGRRLHHWKDLQVRHAQTRHTLASEIVELEQRATNVSTDVAAAMMRGQIAERRRTLAEIEAEERKLERQIGEAELALGKT